MLFYLRVYLVKVTTAVFNFFARRLPHDRKAPRVGWAIRNVPYGEDRKNRLDILVPRDVSSPPVVIYFHGGGWISGTKIDRRRICREIAHNGHLVFNVDYRLAPKYRYPFQMVDVARAVLWVSGNASRYGGDELVVVLPETRLEKAYNLFVRRTRDEIEGGFHQLTGGRYRLSVTIGIASYPIDGTTARELVLAADRALLDAKTNQRTCKIGCAHALQDPAPP